MKSGGADLAVSSWGDDGPPILALHPGIGDRRIWQWCAPSWADAGYRVAAYDRRGFGDTTYHEEPHDDIDDLRAVASATGSCPAILVANSNGGRLAIDFALEYPHEVIGLVLIAPSVSGYPPEAWQESEAEAGIDRLIEAAEESGDLDRVNRLEVRCFLDGAEQPEGRVTGPARDLIMDMNGRALRAAPVGEQPERPPAWPRVEQLGAPTLVIRGAYDLPGFGPLCEELVDRLPNARLAVIDTAAHCPSLDQPGRLDEIILEFLQTVAV